MSTKPRCLVPHCKNKPKSRGLCRRDYGIAFRMIRAGETTWEALEKAGRALQQSGIRNSAAAKRFFLAK